MGKLGAALQLLGVGFFVGISILAGVLGGLWLDERLNTKPLLAIAGLLLGVIVAFYGVYRMLVPLLNSKNKRSS